MGYRLIQYLFFLLVAIFIAAGVHLFCVGSYSISTQSMNQVLQQGDFVLVNKIKDESNPGRDRIVLFQSPLRRDRLSPPLFLSRCAGMPGDTIVIEKDGFRINGHRHPGRTSFENTFRIRRNIKEPLLEMMEELKIPYRGVQEDSLSLTIRLTMREEQLIREKLPELLQIEFIPEEQKKHTFILPTKNNLYRIDSTTLFIFREAILSECGRQGKIRNGKLYIDGEERRFFYFRNNYYWMLSDNEDEAIDSRHLGPIPEKFMVGNVWFCWYSNNPERRFKRIR